jgi:hypothetical protein
MHIPLHAFFVFEDALSDGEVGVKKTVAGKQSLGCLLMYAAVI